jgi:hypothetical protein
MASGPVILTGVGVLDAMAARVASGAVVEFRPARSSMTPLSRQLVRVAPAEAARLEAGDIVLARVAGTVYLHLVSAVGPADGRVRISNNHGRVNGWTSQARVFGICTHADGIPRLRLDGKLKAA